MKRLEAEGVVVHTLDRAPGCTYQVDIASDPLPDLARYDILVGNAAITTIVGSAHNLDLDRWRLDLDVNLTGTFRVLQACLRGMQSRGFGRIVLVSSIAATVGLPGQVAYSASKAGLLGMMKTVAAENISRGITVNAVLPGMTASSGVLAMPKEILDSWQETVPNGFADPEDIAHAVAFFAAPEAGHVSGQQLTVDAGDSLNTRSVTGNVTKSAKQGGS